MCKSVYGGVFQLHCASCFTLSTGPKDWLQCYESNIREVKSKLQGNLAKISVVQSSIVEIRDLASERNGALGVEILYFHNCGIQRLGSNAFRGLNTLKELSLAHNDIERLNVSWFYDLPSLEILDLSFNKISSLDPLVYMQLTKVQRFEINNNLLNCISTENIQAMRRLKDIRIQENPISHICRAKVSGSIINSKINSEQNKSRFSWRCGCVTTTWTTLWRRIISSGSTISFGNVIRVLKIRVW